MNRTRKFSVLSVTCSFMICVMGAVTITINNPPDGNGAVWDTDPVDGTTTDCANGSSVTGTLRKKEGANWALLGAVSLTATNDTGDWTTSPDLTSGAKNSYTASGEYKVVMEVMDNDTFASDTDENFWTIP